MTDPNRDLIGQIARRPPEDRQRLAPPAPPTIDDDDEPDYTDPVDTTMADGKTNRQIIRGEIANAKEVARRWEPRPLPPREEFP